MDIFKSIVSSLAPSIIGIAVPHPLQTIKLNKQIVGGKPKGLYSGLGLYLAKSVPSNTINFMLLQNEYIMALPAWSQGIITKAAAETITYPLGLWATKIQAGIKPSGLYQGLGQKIGQEAIFSTVFLQVYRGWLAGYRTPENMLYTIPLHLMCSATTASIISQPFDWLRVRKQLGTPMNSIFSGWGYRVLYCNVRSVVSWGLFELLTRW